MAEPTRHRWLLAVTIVLYLLVGFPYLFVGLLAPPGGVAVLWAVWLIGGVLLWRIAPTPDGRSGCRSGPSSCGSRC